MRPPRALVRRSLVPLLGSLLATAGCRPTEPTACPEPATLESTASGPSASSVLDHRVRIFDAEGREHSLESMLDALADHRVVLLGETHTDDVTHQVEHAILEGLAQRRDDRVVLSMEMFERDVQPVLDRYLAGEIDEPAMLAEARPWGNYLTGYRPLVETARERGLPIVAANAPRSTLRKATQGPEAYAALRAEHPTWLPETVLPASDEYWARVDRTIRGHGPPRGGDRTYSVQNLWDNAMGDAIVGATRAHEDHAVLHVVGGFHVEAHDGTVAQVRARDPKLDLVTVTVTPTSDLARAEPAPTRADFVVYALDYAEGLSGDRLSVALPSALGYRLHLPEGPPPEGGWPLLVWLHDDELRSDDAVLRWRQAVGDRAAVLVVQPPHRTRAREGWLVRRWAWPQSWSGDLSTAMVGLDRILEYARRRLPVRQAPVLLAGEGAGATLALWSAQYGSDWTGVKVLAIDPELPRAVRSAAIPDDPSGVEQLTILGEPDEGTLAGLKGAGLSPVISPAPAPDARDAPVLDALGLSPSPAQAEAPHPDPAVASARKGQPVDVRVGVPTTLSRSWGALYTNMLRARGHDARLLLGWDAPRPDAAVVAFDQPPTAKDPLPDIFADGRGLPGPPDAFGGAVIVLVPKSAGRDVIARWHQIVEKTEAAQGFLKTPYRVIAQGDRPALRKVSAELRGSGRTEVRVVPAQLCASAKSMRDYLEFMDSEAEDLSLHWLAGMGPHTIVKLSAPASPH